MLPHPPTAPSPWRRPGLAGAFFVLAFALLASASAQTAANALTYRIATNDRIRIGVFQEPDLDMIGRVDAKGTINLHLLGSVKLAGMTIPEAERAVEAAYRDGRFLRNPQVTITVEEYAPREVTIQGQVKDPRRYVMPIEQTMSVLELVTRAGGFTDTARGTAVTITRINADGTRQVFTVDVESMIRGRNRNRTDESSFLLIPGDIVFVPERLF
ncbi:MAG: polysaccharide biosynthesis/export family protein [Opitutaceae bacterium]|nr:polysaccharide biosynthesis/export family protein [Opitutaceae bacterium]